MESPDVLLAKIACSPRYGDLAVEIGLPVHALGNRLDHDVAFAQQLEVLVVVRGTNQRGFARDRERAGFELPEVVDRFEDIAIRVALFRRQLEQQRFDVGVDEVCRDLRAHDAGAEHGGLAHDKWLARGHGIGPSGWKLILARPGMAK